MSMTQQNIFGLNNELTRCVRGTATPCWVEEEDEKSLIKALKRQADSLSRGDAAQASAGDGEGAPRPARSAPLWRGLNLYSLPSLFCLPPPMNDVLRGE